MVARAANLPQGGRRAGTGHQRRRWKSRSTNVQSAEAYPCVLAGLVPANYVASTSPPAENMNHQRDQGKDQKQMNQKARDMVHDEASNPSKKQQHRDGEPDEPTHKPSNESPLQYEPSCTSTQRGESAWGLPISKRAFYDSITSQTSQEGTDNAKTKTEWRSWSRKKDPW